MIRIISLHLFTYFLFAAISPLLGIHVHFTSGQPGLINQFDAEHENKNHFPADKQIPEKNLLQYFFDEGKQLPQKENPQQFPAEIWHSFLGILPNVTRPLVTIEPTNLPVHSLNIYSPVSPRGPPFHLS